MNLVIRPTFLGLCPPLQAELLVKMETSMIRIPVDCPAGRAIVCGPHNPGESSAVGLPGNSCWAARTARAHAHAHSHAALQTAQRSVGTAMMTVTVVAAMVTPVGTATPAVHGHAAGQRVVRRLDRTDHRTAAHDVRQLVGLNVKVLGLDYVR